MKSHTRQSRIIELVRKHQKISVARLATLLEASRETIRRDLTHLAQAGKIEKIHGGAIMPRVLGEASFKQRLSENAIAKTAIARTAAALVQSGETLFIDTGSTTLYFAEEIAHIPGLTIVTNATEIARTLATAPNGHKVFLLGGEFSPDNSQTVGTMTTAQIRSFRAHHVVLTIGALDHRTGAMDFNIEEAQVARAMIAQADKLTVLADSSKVGTLASFEVCALSDIDTLVTDRPLPAEIHADLETGGARIVIATAS